MIVRLILQRFQSHYGDVPLETVRYILQYKEYEPDQWRTAEIKMWDELPEAERNQITEDLHP